MSITSFVGPFPTDFALPSDCSAISSNSIAGFDFKSSCLPEDFNPDTTAYYSPGTACPSGYTAQEDCTRSRGATTTVTCCPVRDDIELWCVSEPGSLSGPWVSMQCTWSAGDEATVLLVTSDSSTMGVTMSGAQGINAYGLRMVYESSDLEVSTSTPSETNSGTKEPPTVSQTSSSATTSTFADPISDDEGGLSTGATVAIGVVIPVVLIALGIGLFFLWRRRRQQAANAAIANHQSKHRDPPGELSGSTKSFVHSAEMYGDMAHSPHHQTAPQELPANNFASELVGDTPPPPPPTKSPYLVSANTPSPVSGREDTQGYFGRNA